MQVKFSDHTDMHNCLFIPPRKEVWGGGAVYKNHPVRPSVRLSVQSSSSSASFEFSSGGIWMWNVFVWFIIGRFLFHFFFVLRCPTLFRSIECCSFRFLMFCIPFQKWLCSGVFSLLQLIWKYHCYSYSFQF